MKSKLLPSSTLLALSMVAFAPQSGQASTNGFFNPGFRGSMGTEFGYWETFTAAVGAPGNLAGSGATTGAVLTQTDPGAFLTGSGNIYSPTTVTAFSLADSTTFTLGTVVLQTRTIGSEIDSPSLRLNYTDGSGAHSLAATLAGETDRSSTPAGTGASRYWQWDLTGLGLNTYELSFHAAGTSMSFDAMTLDTGSTFTPVPEPSAVALGAASLAILSLALWRRSPAYRHNQ